MLVKRESYPTISSLFDEFFSEYAFGKDSNNMLSRRVPSTNIRELDDRYIIDLATPGFKKEDFEINLENRLLIVKSKDEAVKEIAAEKYALKEYTVHKFSRSFTLPDSVDADKMNASYKNGILSIEILKNENEKIIESRKIDIS